MKVDFDLIYRQNRAYRGDVKSMCELVDYFSACDDWRYTARFFELLVDNQPEICEQEFLKNTGFKVPYEMMLGLIGQYYYENGILEPAYRWFQKYLDYMEFKHSSNKTKWEKEKLEDQIYKIMETDCELDKIRNRFMLKWEQELFLNSRILINFGV